MVSHLGSRQSGSLGSSNTTIHPELTSTAIDNKSLFERVFDSSNPIFSAGAGIASLGVLLALSKQLMSSAQSAAQRYLTLSLEVTSRDPSYGPLLAYLARSGMRAQHLSVHTVYSPQSKAVFNLFPSTGSHLVWFKNRPILLQREREKQAFDFNSGTPFESLTLRSPGRDKQFFIHLLHEAQLSAKKQQEGRTIIFQAQFADWKPFGPPRRRRPLSSVILDGEISEKLLNDFREFTQSAKWYIDRGIPYRRGYLLYGPPGCGKTSYIQALAGATEYNICVLNLNERGMTDDKLAALFNSVPPRSIVLLEDIDCVFVQRANQTPAVHREHTLTFSGLLNALDGVSSTEERIIFMTTNYIERLDEALIRPGRVDVQQYIGYATAEQISRMFMRFYPEPAQSPAHGQQQSGQTFESKPPPKETSMKSKLCGQFVSVLQADKSVQFSIADLQGWFLLHKNDPQSAVAEVDQFIQKKKCQSRYQSEVQSQSQTHSMMTGPVIKIQPMPE